MVQEKQLKELFKYIESNWDVCVEDVDKRDIKRIFGGVLCEDIMNDTLHEVKAEPKELKGNCSTFDGSRLVDQEKTALNPIAEAYERGEKIRLKTWQLEFWIQKYDNTRFIDCNGHKKYIKLYNFKTYQNAWELYTEPTEQPSSQVKLDNSFDKDRFEAMFRAVVASGEYVGMEFEKTEEALIALDAYYASKEGGNNG